MLSWNPRPVSVSKSGTVWALLCAKYGRMPSMGLTDVLVAPYFNFTDGIGEVSDMLQKLMYLFFPVE